MKQRLTSRLLFSTGIPLVLFGLVLWVAVANLIVHGQVALYLEARPLQVRSQLNLPFGQSVHIGDVALVTDWFTGHGPLTQEILSGKKSYRVVLPATMVMRTRFLLRAFAFLMLSLVLVTIVTIWFWGRRAVVKPVELLARRVRDLAGRTDSLLDLPILQEDKARQDELGTLARAFADLVARLTSRSGELQETVKHLEAALQEIERTRSQLLQAQQFATLGEFSAGLAHELGNPLAAAMQQLYLIEDAPKEEQNTILGQIGASLGRIDGILRAMQGLYRTGEVEMGPVVLQPSLEMSVARARNATHCPAAIRSGDESFVVTGNRFLVEQSLYNLVKNAMENAGPEGAATIQTALLDGQVLIRIDNSGPAADLDEAGLPVYDPTKGGMGLGVRIVARAIGLMGGILRYETTGRQTRSLVAFPLSPETKEDL